MARGAAQSSVAYVGQTLTAKEIEVWGLLANGLSDGEIARVIQRSLGTAQFHVDNLRRKLGRDKSRIHLALEYWRLRGVQFPELDGAEPAPLPGSQTHRPSPPEGRGCADDYGWLGD